MATSAGLIWLFPLTFLSNAFVAAAKPCRAGCSPSPSGTRSAPFVSACRELFGKPDPYATDSFPSQHPVLMSLIWVVVIVGIFAPLAVRKYRAATTK